MDLCCSMLRAIAIPVVLCASAAAADAPRARAVRRTGDIAIDGSLDERAWVAAPKQAGFTQRFPLSGARATLETSFAVLYDDDAVYVGVWADDPDPTRIRRLLHRRDVDSPADWIAIGFDSYHDHRTAFVFQLNAAGVQRDQLIFDDTSSDDTWDAVWTGEVAVTDRGWTAEFRIPLNQLRFSSDELQQWGFQIVRIIGRTQEQSAWSPWPRSGPQIVSRFGVLDGIDHVESARRLELLPYATAGVDVEPIAAGDPLNDHVRATRNVGLDARYGLSRAFTLSATLNPDFGQVEADPSQVNLGATELFFAEKRPFFLEGGDLFKLPLGNTDNSVEGVFYSRRIGAVPAPPDMDYQYVQAPTATTIYGAAKLTGKTKDGWSVGVVDAVTGEDTTPVIDASGQRKDPVVAPMTNFALARIKRDLRGGATSIGISASAVDRSLDGTPLITTMRDQAYTGGLQLQHRWDDNAWTLDLRTVGSWVHGSPDAVAALQQDNVHLYQRPDARDVHLDPARTSLAGVGATYAVGRNGDTPHLRFGTGGDLRTPGLELNDLGFQTTSDRYVPYVSAQYREDAPSRMFLNWQVNSDVYLVEDFEPRLLGYGLESSASAQLANYWSVGLNGTVADNRWDTVALRGGPALRANPAAAGGIGITSDTRRRVWASSNLQFRRDWTAGATTVQLDAGTTVQVRSNIDLYVGPSFYWRTDPLQYIDQVDDLAGVRHYICGRVHQTTTSLTTRLDWTFSPRLSLQLYAQPFIGSARFSDYKDVDNAHASRFADRFHVLAADEYSITGGIVNVNYGGSYQFGRPDFDLRQLRSTIVLRWEYRPGSTVFAIWSHGQTSQLDDGRFQLGHDLSGLLSAASENLVMIKANYWVGL
jgi:hypothetical protein